MVCRVRRKVAEGIVVEIVAIATNVLEVEWDEK